MSEKLSNLISGGAGLYDFNNTVKAFTDGVGLIAIGESDGIIEVISHRTDELTHRMRVFCPLLKASMKKRSIVSRPFPRHAQRMRALPRS